MRDGSPATPPKPTLALRRREFLLGAAAALPLGMLGCSKGPKPTLVGGLPVTCNLTLPVACVARAADHAAGKVQGIGFAYSKYNGWAELKDALMTGHVQAAYMLAPLVMDLTANNIPVKVVSLGHRSGAVIMVRTDSGYTKFKDLAGKRVAIPSRFAVDFLFLRKMLAAEGMDAGELEIVEMPPPDMPAALYARAVDAYCTGEPFGAAAERAGFATALRMTRDEWPTYICCVLTVREELIQKDRPLVQELVNYVQGAGNWLDASKDNRSRAADIAAGREFFNQDPNIIRFGMDNPVDRVTYGDMRMLQAEFDDLMKLSVEAKTIAGPVPFERYADRSFVDATTPMPITI